MKYLIGIEKLQKITDYKIHTLIKPVKKDCIVIAKLITKYLSKSRNKYQNR